MPELKESFNADGTKGSPILPDHIKNFLIDIDGTVTEDIPNEEPGRMIICKPFADALKTINKWFEDGHTIFFFTSRTEELREITETWLKQNHFHYHGIIFGKPRGGNYHWIDNHIVRATRYTGKFGDAFEYQRQALQVSCVWC